MKSWFILSKRSPDATPLRNAIGLAIYSLGWLWLCINLLFSLVGVLWGWADMVDTNPSGYGGVTVTIALVLYPLMGLVGLFLARALLLRIAGR